MQTATWLHEFKNLPGDVGVQQWMGRQLLGRHHQQSQLCTYQSHCLRQERQRLRHTSWFVGFLIKIKMRQKSVSSTADDLRLSGDMQVIFTILLFVPTCV